MSVNAAVLTIEGVRDRVSAVVAGCLGLPPAEIDPGEPLVLYGLDSLRSIELGAELEDAFRRPLPDELLADHPSIDALVRLLEDGAPRARAHDGDRALALMRADGVLPSDIRPDAATAPVSSPRRVLLTGATGFLGAHLLGTLLAKTDAEVLCLVRDNGSGDEPERRVRRSLERHRLRDASRDGRIHTVTGDLSQPELGLTADARAMIGSTVDSVYHAGADVNWVSPYGALRAANVGATRELLRLACQGRPKAFHFISSLSVCHAVGGRGFVAEDEDLFASLERLPLGYAQSKCVAEALVREAQARGLRASIHRPALLTGDSATGVSPHDDLVSSLFKGCIQMGTAPDLDWRIDAVPVDEAARAIVHLSTTAPRGLVTFHESARQARHWRECVLWMNLYGYPVSLVPYDRWAEQLAQDAVSADHALHRMRGFFLRRWSDGAAVPELYQETRSSAPRSARTLALISEAGLDFRRLDAGLLERYFDEHVAAGFLPPPRRAGWASAGGPAPTADPARARFEPILRRRLADDSVVVTAVTLCTRGSEHSIVGELTGWRHRGRTGLFHHRLELAGRRGARSLDVVTKIKPPDREVIEVAEAVADICDFRLGRALRRHRDRIGLRGAHLRELALYAEPDERLRRHMPFCYGTWRDEAREEWGLVLERLDGPVLMDATEDPAVWTHARVDAALDGLAQIHAVWLGREEPSRAPAVDRPRRHGREHGRDDAPVAGPGRPRGAVPRGMGRRFPGPDAPHSRRVDRGVVAPAREGAAHPHPQRLQPAQRGDSRRRGVASVVRLRLGARDARGSAMRPRPFPVLRPRSPRNPRRGRAVRRAPPGSARHGRWGSDGPRPMGHGIRRRAGGSACQPVDVLRDDRPRPPVAILAAGLADLAATPPSVRGRGRQPIMRAPIHDVHVGNLLTYGSLAAALAAIAAARGVDAPAAAGAPVAAGGWLALAALLDTFDGRFARCFDRSPRQRRLGGQLDSLVDACAFGVAPVVVIASASPHGGGLPAAAWWASAFAYVGAVVTRLGFYNVETDDSRFVGLPAPAAALVWSTYLLWPVPSAPWLVPVLFTGCGLALIAPIAIPRPRAPGLGAFAVWAVSLALWHLR